MFKQPVLPAPKPVMTCRHCGGIMQVFTARAPGDDGAHFYCGTHGVKHDQK